MSLPFYRHEDHGSKLKLIGLFSGVGGLEMGVIGGFADAGFQLKPVWFSLSGCVHCKFAQPEGNIW